MDIKDGKTVKGTQFLDLKDVGDPVVLAKKYMEQGADELVFLDISATLEKRKTLISLVRKINKEISIPFTVGGGISSLEDAKNLIIAGADKISLNSAAIQNPTLIKEISEEIGSQCVVIAIDVKNMDGNSFVVTHSGTNKTEILLKDWVQTVEKLGAGEILLTSMHSDGTKNGFDISTIKMVSNLVKIPVIASGGAGEMKHFKEVFNQTNVTGGLAASIFHYESISIPELKNYLNQEQIPVRL